MAHTSFRVTSTTRLTGDTWTQVRDALGDDYRSITSEGEFLTEVHALTELDATRKAAVISALQTSGISAVEMEVS